MFYYYLPSLFFPCQEKIKRFLLAFLYSENNKNFSLLLLIKILWALPLRSIPLLSPFPSPPSTFPLTSSLLTSKVLSFASVSCFLEPFLQWLTSTSVLSKQTNKNLFYIIKFQRRIALIYHKNKTNSQGERE